MFKITAFPNPLSGVNPIPKTNITFQQGIHPSLETESCALQDPAKDLLDITEPWLKTTGVLPGQGDAPVSSQCQRTGIRTAMSPLRV